MNYIAVTLPVLDLISTNLTIELTRYTYTVDLSCWPEEPFYTVHTYTAEVVLEMLLVGQYVQVRSSVIWLLDMSDLWRAMCTVAILVTFATPK